MALLSGRDGRREGTYFVTPKTSLKTLLHRVSFLRSYPRSRWGRPRGDSGTLARQDPFKREPRDLLPLSEPLKGARICGRPCPTKDERLLKFLSFGVRSSPPRVSPDPRPATPTEEDPEWAAPRSGRRDSAESLQPRPPQRGGVGGLGPGVPGA